MATPTSPPRFSDLTEEELAELPSIEALLNKPLEEDGFVRNFDVIREILQDDRTPFRSQSPGHR